MITEIQNLQISDTKLDVIKKAFIMPYTTFIINDNLVDSFIEIIKAPKPCFEPTFYKIENNKDLVDVLFSTKRNRDSTKYIKIFNVDNIDILTLQTFIAMAEFNRIYIFMNKIPQGLEIQGHHYIVSNKLFNNSVILEDTEFFIKYFKI